MRYLLAGSLGFLLCGVWFGSQLWLTHIFSKRGCHHLIYFSPLFAACIPIVLIIRLNGLYSPRLLGLIKREAVGAHRGNAFGYLPDKGVERKEVPNRGEAGTCPDMYGSRIC